MRGDGELALEPIHHFDLANPPRFLGDPERAGWQRVQLHAARHTGERLRLAVETRVLVPTFAPQILADSRQSYVKALFHDSWATLRDANPRLGIRLVPDTRIFITDDRPDVVREAIDEVARLR